MSLRDEMDQVAEAERRRQFFRRKVKPMQIYSVIMKQGDRAERRQVKFRATPVATVA